MKTLKYKVIKSRGQYDEYCKILEGLLFEDKVETEDEIELLTLLIEKYDKENSIFTELDPVQVIKSLMSDHEIKAKDLATLLGVSKGLVSDILNYKKGLSKKVIRKLATHFKMDQEALNRPYWLKGVSSSKNKITAKPELETA